MKLFEEFTGLKLTEGRARSFAFFVLVTFFLLSFIGCGKKEAPPKLLSKFEKTILNLHYDDGFLSKENIDSLKNLVGDKLDMETLVDSICKVLEKESIAFSKHNITNPIPEAFNVNFFIKNTANMNGYTKPGSQFQDALYGLLADLRSSYRNSKINLMHIGSRISYESLYDSDDAVREYVYKDFAKRNSGNTDFDSIFTLVLKEVDKNSIAILAADFVFSPGKGVDVDKYLERQRNNIRIRFSHKIEELDLTVLALKMESDFEGGYWDSKSRNVGKLVAKRPYYIWFIGSPQHLAKIARDKKLMTSLKTNGYTENKMVFESSNIEKTPNFKVVSAGNIAPITKENYGFIKAKDPKDKLTFSVDVNFNDAFRESAFFADIGNYKWNNEAYELNVKQPKGKDVKWTHNLTLNTIEMDRKEFNRAFKGDLKISIIGKIPEWVEKVNSIDDTNIKTDISEQGRTYGFKHIVEGAYSAFYPTIPMNEPHVLQTLNLNIQLEDK